jgi:hypothetical protein
MNLGRTVFSQLVEFLSHYDFQKCVCHYDGEHKVKSFSCWDQFLTLIFAQLTYRESLRDIEVCLRAAGEKLYHMGIRSRIARNTLANANSVRDWRIFGDFGQGLIAQARDLYKGEEFGLELEQTLYALDATTLDVCLSLFPWAHFRKHKGAVKMHTLLDLRGSIPTLVNITHGKIHDVNILDNLSLEAGAIYVMDRAYLDYERLYGIHCASAFFVTRAKRNSQLRRLYSRPVEKTLGVQCDQVVVPKNFRARKDYPDKLRRIRCYDAKKKRHLIFLTNNFVLPATVVSEIYRLRWQIELFFKWIKQHLRIKKFYGHSENAVKTQIWIAISTYVLVAIIKKRLHLDHSLYTILQILSLTLFEKTPILQVLSLPTPQKQVDGNRTQLDLFD